MRVNNVTDWCRALDANDRQYGVVNLAICDQTALLGYLQRHSHLLPQWAGEVFANIERYDRYDQLGLVMRFYQCNPTYYVDHVVASGALEAPAALVGTYHTTDEILKRLKGAPPPTNYVFAVGEPADGSWSKAIAMLREKIGLSPEGGYDMEAAEKLYQYGRNRWRTGRGYLYSDNNPEVLFDAGYKEYVTVITYSVWRKIGLDRDYFCEDNHINWTRIDTDPNKVMPDMYGRTTGIDEDRGMLSTIRRMLTASSNSQLQDEISVQRHLEQGFEPTREDYHRSIGNKFQRMFWATGAEFSYGALGAELTWYLLMHSLEKYPEPVIIEEGISNLFNNVIAEIKENRDLRQALNKFIKGKTSSFSQEVVGVITFTPGGSKDLFLALNNCTLLLAGEKNEDGSWNLGIEIKDDYDFGWENPFDQPSFFHGAGWFVNDMAHLSQGNGAIHPFPLEIRFSIENYIVPEDKVA